MPTSLKDHLYRDYARLRENSVREKSDVTHLTLYAGVSYAVIQHRSPRDKVFGRSSRPASIHIYGIVDTTFILELRNLPMSVATQQFISETGGEIDEGQNHGTVRLTLRASDTPILRRLAELVRSVPRAGRIDRLSGCGFEAYAVDLALARLAKCLGEYLSNNSNTEMYC